MVLIPVIAFPVITNIAYHCKKDSKEKTTVERHACPKCNLYHSTIVAMTANKRLCGNESHQLNEKNEQESSDESELESSDER